MNSSNPQLLTLFAILFVAFAIAWMFPSLAFWLALGALLAAGVIVAGIASDGSKH